MDLVLVAGDVYDTYNPSAAAEELFFEAMDRLSGKGGRAVIVIAGNHDNPERLCAASPLSYKNGIILLGYPASDAGEYKISAEGISIVDSGPGWLELSLPRCGHNTVIITMPFPSESRLEQLLSREADEAELQNAYSVKVGSIFSALSEKFRDDTVNLIVAHLFLAGGSTSDSERTLQVGGAMTANPDAIPGKAHYAALGHLHRPQQIRSAACPTYYAGSPLAYSFSEAGYSKAVYIVDALPGTKAEVRPVYLDCGKPLKKWHADKGIQQALEWCEEGRDPDAWIDLEILTDRVLTADEHKTIRSLHPGIINIRPLIRSEETEVLAPVSREGRKTDELFRDYYRYRMGVDIPDELMEAFLELLGEDSGQGDVEYNEDDDDSGIVQEADNPEAAEVPDEPVIEEGSDGLDVAEGSDGPDMEEVPDSQDAVEVPDNPDAVEVPDNPDAEEVPYDETAAEPGSDPGDGEVGFDEA